jgi:hypothetical protein
MRAAHTKHVAYLPHRIIFSVCVFEHPGAPHLSKGWLSISFIPTTIACISLQYHSEKEGLRISCVLVARKHAQAALRAVGGGPSRITPTEFSQLRQKSVLIFIGNLIGTLESHEGRQKLDHFADAIYISRSIE